MLDLFTTPESGFIIALLKEHRPLGPATLDRFEDVRLWPDGPMKIGSCLGNATAVAQASGGRFRLVVGIAAPVGRECPHAWICDDDGVGFETTWSFVGSSYAGVVVP